MKMLLLLIYSVSSYANINSKLLCSKEVNEHLVKDGAKNTFSKVFDPKRKILRSPTSKIGIWVQVGSDSKKFNEYWKFNPEKTHKYSISKDCVFTLVDTHEKNKGQAYSIPKFSDSDLETEISKNKDGMIYVFNPSFAYSMKFLKKAQNFSKVNKIKFTPLVSSKANSNKLLKRAIASTGLPQSSFKINTSNELKMMQAELHAPTYVFYKNGKLIHEKLVGVYTDKSLQKNFKRVFK